MSDFDNAPLIRALRRQSVPHTPVWIMRQAGRYLPEYRATRKRARTFMELCQTPELACEVTLQPLRRFALDAAILFSDILTIPHAMGLGLEFIEGQGPRFARPLREPRDIDALPRPDPGTELAYVTDTVRLLRRELPEALPLIGFAGSPWTLATYMVEGQSSREFKLIKSLLYQHPAAAHKLLSLLSDVVGDYLVGQVDAGAQAIMVFDTWGGVLPQQDYLDCSLEYMTRIVQHVKAHAPSVPTILYTKGGGVWLESIAASGCAAVGLDWTVDIGAARRRVGAQVSLQGNLDPMLLYSRPDVIRERVAQLLESYGDGPGHVFNLGHGILPDIDPEHVTVLVDTVHELSAARHAANPD